MSLMSSPGRAVVTVTIAWVRKTTPYEAPSVTFEFHEFLENFVNIEVQMRLFSSLSTVTTPMWDSR